MLEGEYLELVQDLKDKFDEKDREVKEVNDKYDNLKKDFLSAYGFIRVIDNLTSTGFIDVELIELIQILRSFLSDVYDELD